MHLIDNKRELVKMKELLDEFAQNLKLLRKEKDVSLRVLAHATGISKSALHQYERGTADPSLSNLVRIAQYFNKSVSWLIGDE